MNKFESSPIVKEFQKQKSRLTGVNRVIAGVSGGPDSMALLYLLHRFELDTVVVHCNYQLRGEQSDKDQELVEQMCMQWGAECIAVRLDSSQAETQNFQAWARSRRYEIFRDIKEEYDADVIATAHHEDDQIETILQKILRGAGTPAWKGMDVIDQDKFRPLLGVKKSEIMKFVQDFNIPYRIDSTNEESTYARNFLRHNWFPLLNKFFPGWRENLLRIPNRAKEFEAMADEILAPLKIDDVTLHRNFLDVSPDIREAVFLRFYELSGMNIPLSSAALSEVHRLDTLQTGKSVQLSGGVFVYRNRDHFVVTTEKNQPDNPVSFTREQLEDGSHADSLLLKMYPAATGFEESTLNMDADKLKFPIVIRRWENGDSLQPIGMQGTQLVSDHLTNRKIRADLKKRAKVIESFDGMICAIIFPHKLQDKQIGTLAEPLKCTSDTKTILTVRKT